jgi:hypothetical protein
MVSMIDDLAAFIGARLDDDEQAVADGNPAVGLPERALREIAAKRRVLERHRPVGGTASWRAQACAGCGTEGYCDDPVTEKMSDCPELRDMAAVWEDHPDYRGEWAPWAP